MLPHCLKLTNLNIQTLKNEVSGKYSIVLLLFSIGVFLVGWVFLVLVLGDVIKQQFPFLLVAILEF